MSAQDFCARAAWATRRGTPQWLWPEVAIDEWQDATGKIEIATRQILTAGQADEPLRGDVVTMDVAAYTSGMGPLLGFWISMGLLEAPRGVVEILDRHYRNNIGRMARLAQHAIRVVSGLVDRGVPVTVIKGMHTAFDCFPHPGTRPLADIDLYVSPRDKELAGQVLCELQYLPGPGIRQPDEQFWRHVSSTVNPQSLTFAHEEDPWGIDLHTSANRRYGRGSPIIRFDELLCFIADEGWHLHPHGRVTTAPATVLVLACHAGCGFANLRMLRLVELALFIRKAVTLGTLCWDELIEMGKATATLPHAYAALHLTSALAPGTIPRRVLDLARQNVPGSALRVIEDLTPATAHGAIRFSIKERYMWTPTLTGKFAQLAYDIFPIGLPHSMVWPAVKRRLWRLSSGAISG